MFTGIIEAMGAIASLSHSQGNIDIWVSSPLSSILTIDQSISHEGICLTVVELKESMYRVTAIAETINKTTIGDWQVNKRINLERCMPATGRFDGHIVQGHVDQRGECISVTEQNGSWIYEFKYQPSPQNIVVEKGSICINGTSLTAFDTIADRFKVAIIPYTYEYTTIYAIVEGSWVNLEFDIIGKYVARIMQLK